MSRQETIARYVPGPLAVVVLLLVVLIVLTPVLLSTGPPAPGSLLTQAELIVDRVPGANSTHFYLRGLGTTVRYSDMSVRVATGFNWTGSFPAGPLSWGNGTNGTNVITLVYISSANPIALNVSAFYQVAGGSALYVGLFAFVVTPSAGSTAEMLYSATGTPGLTVGAPLPVSSLPITLLLADVGSGP